ncbi:hypothetical protein EAO28_09445 [Klebsiella pneumoniae]|uniref:Uncharacterized protein n=1 Tax=Klebsiella pneumoniae TaxID=573 RepID=A0A3P2EK58_KLEPN|nr:hypothetical protein EAO28_09445 [Klebsiella pneumoniae]
MCQPISVLALPGWCSAAAGRGRIKTAGASPSMKVKAVAHSRIPSRAFSRRSRNWFRITPLSPVPSSPIFVRPTAGGWPWRTPIPSPANCGAQLDLCAQWAAKGYKSLKTGNFHPVGETDSEKAFCWLLHRLTERYPRTPGNMLGVFSISPPSRVNYVRKGCSTCCCRTGAT